MLFNSTEFIFVFLPVTLFLFFFLGSQLHQRAAVAWLVLASLFYYSWWNPIYLWLLVFSILFNFSTGRLLSSRLRSKLFLSLGVAVNLALLGYFKYANFFVDNINGLLRQNFTLDHVVLPLAISFFTFQQIVFLVDAYRNETREYNFLHYSLFVTFFPQLIAGPIVHHKEMLPQFADAETYRLKISNLNIGMTFFIIGLFKKVVLADGIAAYSTPVFSAADAGQALTFFDAWGGSLAYSLQLYFDFSGYADIAIGIGKMFGITLPLNFNSPYKSKNIIEFWRCWHLTLSRFLKDYLYIPLGGNRKGSRYVNLMITMLLGGLWHGAAWSFVIWGVLHGFYLAVNNLWRSFRQNLLHHDLSRSSLPGKIFSTLLTFVAVTVAWGFFRAETLPGAMSIFCGMSGKNGFALPEKLASLLPEAFTNLVGVQAGGGLNFFPNEAGFLWILILLIMIFFFPNTQEFIARNEPELINPKGSRFSPHRSAIMAAALGFMFFLSIKIMLAVPDSEFLYFNF